MTDKDQVRQNMTEPAAVVAAAADAESDPPSSRPGTTSTGIADTVACADRIINATKQEDPEQQLQLKFLQLLREKKEDLKFTPAEKKSMANKSIPFPDYYYIILTNAKWRNNKFFDPFTRFVKAKPMEFTGSYSSKGFTGRVGQDGMPTESWVSQRPDTYNYCTSFVLKLIEERQNIHKSMEEGLGRDPQTETNQGIEGLTIASYHSQQTQSLLHGSSSSLSTENDGSKEEANGRGKIGARTKGNPDKKKTEGIVSGTKSNKGHIIPRPTTECAPIHALYCPPILGIDVDKLVPNGSVSNRRDLMQQAMRMACIGKYYTTKDRSGIEDADEKEQHWEGFGLAFLQENNIYVPNPNEEFFDGIQNGDQPSWLFLPVLTMQEAANYDHQSKYSVIAIAGLTMSPASLSQNRAKMKKEMKKEPNEVEVLHSLAEKNVAASASLFASFDYVDYCGEEGSMDNGKETKIRTAFDFLRDCVLTLADLVTNGYPAGNTEDGGNIMPVHLDRVKGKLLSRNKKEAMEKIRSDLDEKRTVLVPEIIEGINLTTDMEVCIVEFSTKMIQPDPLLLGMKNAINWMAQNNQKPLPANSPPPDDNIVSSQPTSWVPTEISIPHDLPSPSTKVYEKPRAAPVSPSETAGSDFENHFDGDDSEWSFSSFSNS